MRMKNAVAAKGRDGIVLIIYNSKLKFIRSVI